MINRAAIILKYKKPAIDWINSVDSTEECTIELEEANEERTVYLIDEESAENLIAYLEQNYLNIFKYELMDWYTDERLWPKKLTLEMFNEWFDVECHTVIEDLVGNPIIDEDK